MALAIKITDRVKKKTIDGKSGYETEKKDECFRIAHDNEKIIRFWKAKGFTITGHDLIVGSKSECFNEINRLGINPIEPTI